MDKAVFDALDYLRRCTRRYEWIRENPAWESEAFLSGLSPDKFDVEIDKRISEFYANRWKSRTGNAE